MFEDTIEKVVLVSILSAETRRLTVCVCVSYSKTDPEGCMEAHFYILEKGFACTEKRSRGKLGTIIVSVDFKDFIKWHSPPLSLVKDMLVMLKDHYPERLHRVYLVDAPVVFRFLWSLIKPFVDQGTKHKFLFVSGEQERMQVFGSIMEKDECMPYQRPDGTLLEDVDMDKFYGLPFETAFFFTMRNTGSRRMHKHFSVMYIVSRLSATKFSR